MTGRSQVVYLEGCYSPSRDVIFGVPQGSILGPLLYFLFTNEFPEVIHCDNCETSSSSSNSTTWTMNTHISCKTCGSIVIYADDSTFSTCGEDAYEVSGNITRNYKTMEDFLSSSGLKVNSDKTHCMVLTTEKMRRTRNISVTVTLGDTVSSTSEVERLLGGLVHQNLKWTEMIIKNENSLIKGLQSRTNALSILRGIAPFKVRKMIAEGIWASKLSSLIAVYGGTEEYLIKALQTMQNNVARIICNRGRQYSSKKALLEVGWLPVRDMITYHSLIQAKKTLETENPRYLYEKLVGEKEPVSRYMTRLKVGVDMVSDPFRLELARKSWRWRVKKQWGKVPGRIRGIEGNMRLFKSELKKWLMEQ